VPETNDRMVAALLREREGYVRRGLPDRVAQVDEQLAHYGYAPQAADTVPPEGRTAEAGQVTADASAERAVVVAEAGPEVSPAPEGEPVKRGRGRPKLPRDDAGNVIRD
jgi:hypothetical protein